MRKRTAISLTVALVAAILLLVPALNSPLYAYTPDTRPVLSVTALPGSVLLKWTQPPVEGITGYVIRRGTEPGQADRWPINDFPVIGNTYQDLNLIPGTTYHYIVVPVLADGSWSWASQEVAVTPLELPKGYRLVQFHLDSSEAVLSTHEGEERVLLRGKPLLHQGRVLVPMEDLADLLGVDLSRSPETGIISYRFAPDRVAQMEVGKPGLMFGAANRPDLTAPVERDGHVYLPLRWIVAVLDGKLECDTLSRSVIVSVPPAN